MVHRDPILVQDPLNDRLQIPGGVPAQGVNNSKSGGCWQLGTFADVSDVYAQVVSSNSCCTVNLQVHKLILKFLLQPPLLFFGCFYNVGTNLVPIQGNLI